MNWWQRLLRRDRLERELDAELRFHIDHLVGDYMAAGLSEPEARTRALAEFGAVDGLELVESPISGLPANVIAKNATLTSKTAVRMKYAIVRMIVSRNDRRLLPMPGILHRLAQKSTDCG